MSVAEQEIDNLRRVLFLARKETQVALQKFNQVMEAERKAQAALVAAEDRRSELSQSILFIISNATQPPTVSMFVEYHNTHGNNMLSCKCFPAPRSSPAIEIGKTPLPHPLMALRSILTPASPLNSPQHYPPTKHSRARRLLRPIVPH